MMGSRVHLQEIPHKKRNVEIALFVFIVCGAEGESRKIHRFFAQAL